MSSSESDFPSIPADPEHLADEIARTAAHLDAAAHRLLTCIRMFDESGEWHRQGALSCAHWLTWRISLDPNTAREKVRVARALATLPEIDSALRQGLLSYAKVRALTRVATPENESSLLEMARFSTGAQLERLCRKLRRVQNVTEDGDRLDDLRYFKEEHLDSGMVRLTVVLHPDEAAVVTRAIDEARRESQESKPAATTAPPVSPETALHRLIPAPDALVQIAQSYLAHGNAARPSADRTQIVLHLEQDVLAPDGTLCATLDDGRRLSAETFRRLACDSSLVAMLHGPAGQILHTGRRSRTASPALLRALRTRDGGCRFPGCTHRLYIHAHHIEHWAHGGETTLENLALLCSTHHRLVHEGGFSMAAAADGSLTFRDPQGRPISTVPKPAPLEGEPLDLLSTWNRQAGALLDEEIPYPQWDGTPLDYHEAVAAALRT